MGMRKSKRAQADMANNPKKVKDPTEVALSAIQEALNINDTTTDTSRTASRSEAAPPIPSSEPPSFDEPSFEPRESRTSAGPNVDRPMFLEDQRPSLRPANDDRETIGQLLQAIQKGRPTRNVYTLASAFAGVWIVGAVLLTIAFL